MIQNKYKQKTDKFHIIGHSLGAHIAGGVGYRISGLARITGETDSSRTLLMVC